MLPTADYFRVDWRPEFKKLDPYLRGRGGVVRIDFSSDQCATDKFNHILKQDFGNSGNGSRLSLRVDDDWSTTYTVDDQINAFAKKLSEANVVVHWPKTTFDGGDMFSSNTSAGNMTLSAGDITLNGGFDRSTYAVAARVRAMCDAMGRYIASGGRFMVIVNDMKKKHQGQFWTRLWNAGLSKAVGDNLLLIYFVGPKCGHRPHKDAPTSDLCLTMPLSIDNDDSRANTVYDDIYDIFANAGYSNDAASMAGRSVVAGHGHSIEAVQVGLFKVIGAELKKKREAEG